MHPLSDIAVNPKGNDWPDPIEISIWLVLEDGQWSALASEFDVVGMGRTKEAALENLFKVLGAYLGSFQEAGASLADARRPIPRKEQMRLRLLQGLVAIRALRHRWVRQSKVDLPWAGGFARC